MPIKSEYTQGTPNWVDLQARDQDAAKKFYSELFGWEYDDRPMPEGPVYSMATLRGENVAAIAPLQPDAAAAGAPANWNTYIAVDDVDATVGKVPAAGGQVLMPAFDVGEAGRMTFVTDPTGAAVGLWQANKHIGASLVGDPGACVWNELNTGDVDAAVAFYTSVFGITTSQMSMGPEYTYTLFEVGGDQVCGCGQPLTAGTPNHWRVYFAVEDVDASAAKVVALGGKIVEEAMDIPTVGRMAGVADPEGAVFSIMTPAERQES
ncbi:MULTISPECIES: VOC family protein [unclassified Rhodococcus (in: high G+C Gram-positive bacteria)]|uniref:VOC family protein n=1 Tax=unclassified Rhodococcus (in: high G+C Gram-positive bacteria) TaxID=192944 RepID=UPI0016399C99|nr:MULTISPECIES: VOC family protein [unclassified Rhodococcus (in: high G+C Gram-positive bacteria)]MBC2641460.1 VOC family protein [Rhodococcus sp. 3A]MBC2893795.1 VOC family protein [Rhodococcus sp. 4CII]